MPSPDRPDAPANARDGGAMRYRVRHVTSYDYGEDVPVSHHLLHLTARPHPRQRVRRSMLTVLPAPAVRSDHIDYFGNTVTYVAVQEPHRQFVLTAESEVEVFAPPPLDAALSQPWESVRDSLRSLPGADNGADGGADIGQYCFDSALVAASPMLLDYARQSFTPGRLVVEAALDLMHRIHREFTFDPAATTVATPLAEVMRHRRGVCQDFAHIVIGCVRSVGLPARYVSGYLRTLPPAGQPRLVGADVSHAWASVWCGSAGWVDLCPTNDRRADQDFITIAWGRDYDDVSPARGVLMGGAGHALTVSVDVEPLEEVGG
ncbi:transglutaminase family protein [Azospirillum soli]|uniref:transglutaminase family protein n=1 Tax=Azospirillum soli TaxID=1304799 RepID=UPI001FE6A034|nr:transglutaminase family protein [Azospirillum soli]MBP2314439.1 transglutaminase-like putative cysteine protease [Azospirillum soli]